MKKKKIVIALGHEALGTTLPEQQAATKRTAKAVADFKAGKTNVVGWLTGQVMKASKGKANPGMVNQKLREMLK